MNCKATTSVRSVRLINLHHRSRRNHGRVDRAGPLPVPGSFVLRRRNAPSDLNPSPGRRSCSASVGSIRLPDVFPVRRRFVDIGRPQFYDARKCISTNVRFNRQHPHCILLPTNHSDLGRAIVAMCVSVSMSRVSLPEIKCFRDRYLLNMSVNHGGTARPPRICTAGDGNDVRPPEFSTYNVLNNAVCRLLWPPSVADADIIFFVLWFLLSSVFLA